ncbi:MAG: zinc-finger domain-containing protein [Thiohalocapsa sp.]|jgi:uncharacterized Zn-finger protein|uniref:zinc-finger domain-containing protein n=1 Tax=Thiohalocapsa sp. TaxID=2497641 RepID=UPI0025DE0AE4|nr:zinc-finger domain-containing protein [Thiohalocapsa sp.]MCG6943403.1 zinc-finger domain-containing protein [Thiohalocapsa sp.]
MLKAKQDRTPAEAGRQPPPPVEGVRIVTRKDLPLSCPMPDAPLWNMHPRVYLPIEDDPDHEATCPYCGARYRLEG